MNLSVTRKAYLWALVAGISYVLCFPQFDIPILGIFFLPAFLFSIHNIRSKKQALAIGFLLSSMVAWGGFHWIIYVAQYFGQMPLPFAILLLCLYCLVAAPQMVAFALLGFRFRYAIERLPLWFRPIFWACLYVGLEFLARLVKIFPENLGNTWIAFSGISQVASLGGVALLSFIPLLIGAAIAYVKREGKIALPTLFTSLVIVSLAHFWGNFQIQKFENLPLKTLKIGIVQHNMDDAEAAVQRTSALHMINTIITRLLDRTDALAKQKPDLILWPETAFPTTFPTGVPKTSSAFGYANLVKDLVRQNQVPLLFGGYETDGDFDYNAALLLDGTSGEVLSTYRKNVLLIFGEYFPFLSWFPSLRSLNPMLGDFGRGPGPVPLYFSNANAPNGIKLGVNICYEAILPEYMRGYATAGTHIFVNLTKDSWFGNTFEPWQHLQLSQLRSIEHRIPMVRATNTGLSGTVSITGKTKLLSNPFEEAHEVVEIAYLDPPQPSLYTLWGDWFAYLSLLLSLSYLAYRRS
jgi:apolipoprotein N-acyltransferase